MLPGNARQETAYNDTYTYVNALSKQNNNINNKDNNLGLNLSTFVFFLDTMIDVNAAITLLERKTWKNFQALNGIRTYDLCVTDAMLSQLSY